jgi:hypothetical protein
MYRHFNNKKFRKNMRKFFISDMSNNERRVGHRFHQHSTLEFFVQK